MSWILKAIAILGVATAFSVLSPTVQAQVTQRVPTQPEPTRQETNPELNRQSNEKPNLNLLAKTLINFLKSDRYQTQSKLQLNGSAPGMTFTSEVQLNTITQLPNKFRTEVVFTQSGKETNSRYLVVSDGKQVWIHRPDLKQYTILTYENFQKSDDAFLIGVSTMIFLEVPPDFRETLLQNPDSEAVLFNILKQMGADNSALKASQRNVEGQDYYVYQYTEPKEEYTFNAFVEPATAIIKQLEIVSKYQDLDILIKEQINSRVGNPQITPNTFVFVPSVGSKKVESLRIEP